MRELGKRVALFRRAGSQQHRRNGSRLADAIRHHVGPHELHRVVNRHARGNRAARRIDVQREMSFSGILRCEEQQLRGHQVGHVVVNRRADENDVILQQARINIVGALAAVGLLDHHGNERCRVRIRTSCLSHSEFCRALRSPEPRLRFTLGCRLDPGGAVEPIDCLVAAQLRFHPIERPLLCQASAHRCCRFATTLGERCDFFFHLFVGRFDVFRGRDAVEQQSPPSRRRTARSCWRLRSATQSTFTARGSTPCAASERTDALQARIHLAFDQRFRHGEVVALDENAPESFRAPAPSAAASFAASRSARIFCREFGESRDTADCGSARRHPSRIRRSARAASFP